MKFRMLGEAVIKHNNCQDFWNKEIKHVLLQDQQDDNHNLHSKWSEV